MATTTKLRTCKGSATFGIEPHEAPIADFPVQPSRKDGLGAMCKPHWTEYTRALRQAQRARALATTDGEVPLTGASPAKVDAVLKATTKRERRRTPMAHVPDPKLVAAQALVDEVDALPGPEHVKAIGTPEVQDAFETVARANGHRREREDVPVETPVGETIDSGTEEADAA